MKGLLLLLLLAGQATAGMIATSAWQVSDQCIEVACSQMVSWDRIAAEQTNFQVRVDDRPVAIHELRLQFHLKNWILRMREPLAATGRLEVIHGETRLRVRRPEVLRKEQRRSSGDPLNGRRLFLSTRIGCTRCHELGGRGQAIGPSLEQKTPRDIPWVRADIVDSFEAVHPRFPRVLLTFNNGLSAIGVAQAKPTYWRIGNGKGELRRIDPRAINVWQLMPGSIMPPDYDADLSAAEIEDIVAFLCAQKDPPAALPP